MQIACPSCDERYRIEPARLPARRVRAACLACGRTIFLRAANGAPAAAPAAPVAADEEVPLWTEPAASAAPAAGPSAGQDVTEAAVIASAAGPEPAAPAVEGSPDLPPADRPLAPYLDRAVREGTRAAARAEPEVEARLEPQVEARFEPQVERPPFEPQVEPPLEPQVEPPFEPQVEPPFEPQVEPPFEPQVEPPFEPQVEPPFEPQVEPRVEAESVPQIESESESPFPGQPGGPAPEPWIPATDPSQTGAGRPAPGFSFAKVGDASARAQRLARALVSDILVYHPKKVEEATREGNLKGMMREEVEKSWDEYCERLGPEVARANRQHFVAALNEILARGNSVF